MSAVEIFDTGGFGEIEGIFEDDIEDDIGALVAGALTTGAGFGATGTFGAGSWNLTMTSSTWARGLEN